MPSGDKTQRVFILEKKPNSRLKTQRAALGGNTYFNITLKIKLLDRTHNKPLTLL